MARNRMGMGMSGPQGMGMGMSGPQGNWATSSSTRSPYPTGGSVAKSMRPSPYALMQGGYRKPNQSDILNELRVFTGFMEKATIAKIDGFDGLPRHVCVLKPYFHFLTIDQYVVTLPEIGDVGVQYMVHGCGKILVNSQTLP